MGNDWVYLGLGVGAFFLIKHYAAISPGDFSGGNITLIPNSNAAAPESFIYTPPVADKRGATWIADPKRTIAETKTRISSQAATATALGLPKTLYSVAQPGAASIIQSLTQKSTITPQSSPMRPTKANEAKRALAAKIGKVLPGW